jgi:hypothetical protein
MSVTSSTSEEVFVGADSDSYSYTQNTSVAAHINAAILDESGVSFALTYGTHFDLSGVGGAGGITLTYPNATSPAPYDVNLQAGEKMVIWIEPPHTNSFNPTNNGTWSPAVLGDRMDEIIRILQKHEIDISRCYHVDVGATAPAASGTSPVVNGGRVLLDETIATASSTVEVSTTNWPATYDIIEIDLINVLSSDGMAYLITKPVDNGSATTSNLDSNTLTMIPAANASSGADWDLDSTYAIGNTADDALSGLIRLAYSQSGYLTGFGNFTFMNASTHYGEMVWYRTTTAAQTRPDGVEFSLSSGTLSGTFRLWGVIRS